MFVVDRDAAHRSRDVSAAGPQPDAFDRRVIMRWAIVVLDRTVRRISGGREAGELRRGALPIGAHSVRIPRPSRLPHRLAATWVEAEYTRA